jgi:asparagine synthase (glutamine-hydrolysing)
MCGIAGIIVSEIGSLTPQKTVVAMRDSLTHRGPDDEGIFLEPNRRIGLAHTRLSILDLSPAGHQPMHDPATGNWIVFNGEIYNYRELREELGAAGSRERRVGSEEQRAKSMEHGAQSGEKRSVLSASPLVLCDAEWKSNTDTEVILRAYASWGRDCLQRLRGMFAFAIWDEERQELFLARDQFGIKPLYYYQNQFVFIFASEVRALLQSGLVPRKLSREALASYLQFGSVQDPLTIVDGIRALFPGHCLVVKLQKDRLRAEISQYSTSLVGQTDSLEISSRADAVKLLRVKLEDSVRAHLVSDVPVAAFLSGGIDSSAIVALMSRVTDESPRTFNVSFNEVKFSEQSYANLIAHKFKTEHEDIRLSSATLMGMLPNALAAMDQPTMDGINTYVVSKAVRDAGIKVALSGLGGDELFAGYPSFRRAMQLGRLGTVPSAIRCFAASAAHSFTNGSARHRKMWDLLESDCSPYAAYSLSRRLFAPDEIVALTRDGVSREALGVRCTDAKSTIDFLPLPLSSLRKTDIVNQVSVLELTGYMANTLLRDTDQMSMAHALEVRVPFVDPVVASFVLGLPGAWKFEGLRPKPFLLDAVGDLLPEEIWQRPKMGFTLPFERWMTSGLESELNVSFCSRDLSSIGMNSDSARGIWEAFKKSPQREPWSRPWALYVLTKWCEVNDVHL